MYTLVCIATRSYFSAPQALGDLRQWKRLPPLPPSPHAPAAPAAAHAASVAADAAAAAADLIGRRLPRPNRAFALAPGVLLGPAGGALLQGGSSCSLQGGGLAGLEEALEGALRSRVAAWRDLNLRPRRRTAWDQDLEALLDPALMAYEAERCLGVSGIGSLDFQESVRGAVSDGWAFKGYPACFGHADPAELWRALLAAAVVVDLLATVGGGSGGGGGMGGPAAVGVGEAAFALRVRVHPYPEGTAATWVMLAVKAPA